MIEKLRNHVRLRRIAIWVNAFFPFLHSAKYLLAGRTILGTAWWVRDWLRYRRAEAAARSGFELSWRHSYPSLHDRFERAGTLPRHYFLQDLKLLNEKSSKSICSGDCVDGSQFRRLTGGEI
jgi:hypothetical protein